MRVILAQSQIIKFLRGDIRNFKGMFLGDMQKLPDYKLERANDVIPWMFPTDIASKYDIGAPLLSPNDILAIKADEIVLRNIQLSLNRMIEFYERNDYWITQRNHNYLRITRILRCLWLAGLIHDYVCLSRCLDDLFVEHHDLIGENTYNYWKHADDDHFMRTDGGFKQDNDLTPLDAEDVRLGLCHI